MQQLKSKPAKADIYKDQIPNEKVPEKKKLLNPYCLAILPHLQATAFTLLVLAARAQAQ